MHQKIAPQPQGVAPQPQGVAPQPQGVAPQLHKWEAVLQLWKIWKFQDCMITALCINWPGLGDSMIQVQFWLAG